MAFAVEGAGLFVHEFNTAAAALFLVLSAAFDGLGQNSEEAPRAGGRARALAGWMIALAGLSFLPISPTLRFFAISIWFSGLAFAATARGRTESPMGGLAAASLLFGLFEYAAGTSLLTWYEVRGCSHWLTRPDPTDANASVLGPSFSGIHLALLALMVVFSAWCCSERRSWVRLAVSFGAVGLVYAGWLAFWADCAALLPEPSGRSAWGSEAARLFAALYPVHLSILFPLVVGPVAALAAWRFSRRQCAPEGGLSVRLVLASAVVAILGFWSLTNWPTAPQERSCKVAFYEKGFLNWLVPTHDNYGSYSAGMFGNLPKLMSAMGWTGELIPDITTERLAGADILVIINQDELFSQESLDAVRAFVHGGGGLLLLGDHTCWKHDKVLVNEPLEALGSRVRIAFDSADFFVGGWLHSYQYFPHPATARLGDSANDAGSVVGASLEVHYPAVPIVIGRYGYSDPGVFTKGEHGYLGTLDFEPGEPLGDLPLVAAETIGKGRVIVAGDTSGFVNGILTHSHPFVRRVFEWLASPGRAAVPYWRDRLGVLLLGAAGALAWAVLRRRPTSAIVLAALFLACGAASQGIAAGRASRPLVGQVALVDDSRLGQVSMEGWRPDGIFGVYLSLMREGYFTVGMKDFDPAQVAEADLIVSVAPTRPYSGKEIQAIQSFLHKGGTYLLAVGWEERAGAESFLSCFGMGIDGLPLGHNQATVAGPDLKLYFWKAWPVQGGQGLATIEGRPVVAEQRVGKGRLVVIGDSHFLTSKNLEGEDGVVMPNIHFLRRLIAPPEGAR